MEDNEALKGSSQPLRARVTMWFVFACASATGKLSRLLKMGSGRTLPGRLVTSLLPNALTQLAAPYRLALVSATNGKTTTTKLLASAVAPRGSVVSNTDGANLTSGLVSALLAARRRPAQFAVLEVDEVALVSVLARTRPEVLVLLNLSRDQLDRTSEVADHVRRWSQALAGAETVRVVANADDALVVAAVLGARPHAERVLWVHAGKAFRDDTSLCPQCGSGWDTHAEDWRCDSCGLSRPAATWRLVDEHVLTVAGQGFDLQLDLPGRANAANAAMATAAAHCLGVPIEAALDQIRSVHDVDGRYSRSSERGHDLRLLLAKNPAGWLEALDQLKRSREPVVVAVNAREPDGGDPSWLWDVPFERLRGRRVVASGERAWDVAVRLTYAEVEHEVEPDAYKALELLPPGACDVVANYTAFVKVRSSLSSRP